VELGVACANALVARAANRARGGSEAAAADAASDALRARRAYQRALSMDPSSLDAVTRQVDTYTFASGDSAGLRDALEAKVARSDVPVLIWEDLARLYSVVDRSRQLHCLNEALLSAGDVETSDRLLRAIHALERTLATQRALSRRAVTGAMRDAR